MTFAKRVIRFQSQVKSLEIDKISDPLAVASHFLSMEAAKEEVAIREPRASAVYDGCMRKCVLGTKHSLAEKRYTNVKSKFLFGMGNAVHYWLQNTPDIFGSERYGWWRCLACGKVRYEFGPPPRTKCSCGASVAATVYHEHQVEIHEPVIVTGHLDMFVKVQTKYRVVDFKTIEGEHFKRLAAPLIENLWQIQTYMWAASQDQKIPVEIDSRVGYIAYVSKKDFEGMLPVKMFPVKRDEELLDRIKSKLMLYKKGLKDFPKNVPAMVDDCPKNDFNNWRFKSCVAQQYCRALKERWG